MPNNNTLTRPPIVVIMGHIDHGKTTLLDYIRKTSVATGESGGITQHIGAYVADKITFIDTPGHEAFSKMRSRGARVADIAVLVVAADDGVKLQTKEALEAIKTASIPFAVAINKIDKPAANADKVKNELAELGVFLEGRGGNVPFVEISAKSGEGVPQLLETILLLAELENMNADPAALASGVVIESHLDPKRGISSTLLIRDGSLKKGEVVLAGGAISKVRIFENFLRKSISEAGPSTPVAVVGFDKLPAVGSEFKTFATQKEAEAANQKAKEAESQSAEQARPEIKNGQIISLALVIKTDVLGSAEAIEHEISKLQNDRLEFKILRRDAGVISEDDVKLASSAKNPLVIGFKVSTSQATKDLAERLGVEVRIFDIIYEIGDFLKEKIDILAPKEAESKVFGSAKILKIFSAKGKTSAQIIGGKVLEGFLEKGAPFNLSRRNNPIGEGKIENLQSGKINVGKVEAGSEFGAQVACKVAIAEGDTLEVFSN